MKEEEDDVLDDDVCDCWDCDGWRISLVRFLDAADGRIAIGLPRFDVDPGDADRFVIIHDKGRQDDDDDDDGDDDVRCFSIVCLLSVE